MVTQRSILGPSSKSLVMLQTLVMVTGVPSCTWQGEAMLQGIVMLASIDLVGWALSSGRHE